MSEKKFTLESKKLDTQSAIDGFHFIVKLNCVYKEPGVTTINWKSYLGITNEQQRTAAGAELFLKISSINGSSSVTEVEAVPWLGDGKYYNFVDYATEEKIVSSGAFDFFHNPEGKAIFNITLDGNIGGWKDNFIDTTTTITLDDNIPYTKCGAPTSVTASGIITPSGSFTVSWTGATAGHANTINGYRVFYLLSSDGSAPSIYTPTYKDVSASTTSTSFTLNNATRGYKIVCGVITKGSVSGYDSTIKTGGLITINSLPGAPSVSVDKTIVPSTGDKVTFNITAGSDKDSSQTRTLYYSTSSTGTKTKITSPWVPTVNATTTYYFWTYDGLEFSNSYDYKTITKNTKPTFNVSISSQSLASVNNNSGYNYTISPTITLSNIAGGQQNKKYTYTLHYGKTDSTTNSKPLYESDTATQKTISDIRKEGISDGSSGVYYKISVQCYDGIEYSDRIVSEIRYVTRTPSLVGLYNKDGFTNIQGFYNGKIATHYSKFLGFEFEKDDGYDSLKFVDSDGITRTISLYNSNSNKRGSWTDSKNIASGIQHNLSYSIGYQSGYFSSNFTQNIIKIGTVSLYNFNFSQKIFNYFTDTGTYSNTIGHSYSAAPLQENAIKNYGIASKLNSSHLFFKIYGNSKWSSKFELNPYTGTTNDSQIGFLIKSSILVSAIDNLNYSNKNFSYNITFRLYLTNDFEDEVFSETNFIVNFQEISEAYLQLKSYTIYPTSKSYDIRNWEFLTEGMRSLSGDFEISSYNTGVKGEIQIKRSTESNWNTLYSFNFTGNGTASPGHPVIYSAKSIPVQEKIGELSSPSYMVSYKLIIKTDAGSREVELYNSIPVRGHIPATLVVKSSTFSADGQLTIFYEVNNFGAKVDDGKVTLDNGQKISLYLDGSSEVKTYIDTSSNFFNTTDKIAIFKNYNFGGKESNLVKLGITTTLYTHLNGNPNVSFSSTKTTNLDNIAFAAIFNILPTVAYRKNHLGINILDPSANSNAIITIGESQGRDTIYFQSSDGKKYCKIEGFYFNGGEWT